MTYEDFLLKLIEIGVQWEEPEQYGYGYSRYRKDPKAPRLPAQIQSRWRIGGVSGGSCWDDGEGNDPHYSLDGDVEPEFTDLDDILAEFSPQITFIQYKQLCSKLITTDTEQENEYYGNYTSYGTKTVKCRELFDYLVQKGLI